MNNNHQYNGWNPKFQCLVWLLKGKTNPEHSQYDFTSQPEPYRTLPTQTDVEDSLQACVIEYGGNLDIHLPLVEFVYNKMYHYSIDMASYGMLYGRKCRTPTCWLEPAEKQFASSKIMLITEDKVRIACD